MNSHLHKKTKKALNLTNTEVYIKEHNIRLSAMCRMGIMVCKKAYPHK